MVFWNMSVSSSEISKKQGMKVFPMKGKRGKKKLSDNCSFFKMDPNTKNSYNPDFFSNPELRPRVRPSQAQLGYSKFLKNLP